MPSLRLTVTVPLLCLLACTATGGPGDDPRDEPAKGTAPAGSDAQSTTKPDELARPSRPPRQPISGELVPSEIPVDDGDRCADDDGKAEAAPIDPAAAATEGRMAIKKGDAWLGLPLRETRYDTVVVGTMAETSVVQVFHNPTPDRLEALYNFPLPADAAVDDYWIRVGGREIRGVMKTRDEARKTYEQARDAGQSAALLEQNRPNIFAQSVANIPPGGTIEVEMHIVQPLRREAGRYALVLPITVGPRYVPGQPDAAGNTPQVPDAAKIDSPRLAKGVVSCSKVDIAVAIENGFPVDALKSKYHALTVERAGNVTRLELARGQARPNRDFDLSWQLAGAEPRAMLMAQKTADGGGYFTLTVEPPQGFAQEKARPRELVFALDTSGSMGGEPMDTSVALVKKALDGMGPDDTFNVLRFAGDTSQLSDAPLKNTPENRKRGVEFLSAMAGWGGTEMMAGIKAALDRRADPERLRMVMFLTDGYIGNETEIFQEIEQRLGDTRLFGLGVGSSVNHYLLDGMSRIGRGAVTYVGPGEKPDSVVERFYGYVGRPVLTDIELEWNGLPVADVVPNKLPDLFAGQPVVVYGRFTGDAAGQATLKGKLGGAPIEIPVKLDFAAGTEHTGLASMWARQQVDAMLGYPNSKSSESDEKIVAAVTELAIKYRVMTQFTSFVAVEQKQEQQPDGTLKTVQVPLEMPLGVEDSAEAYGVGGLGLVGTGRGGGGTGYGTIGLGNTGLIGRGGGGGTGSGYGRGTGAGFGGRGMRVPTVRQAKAEVVGSLDKDIIRRIVRAHINEVRYCYNQALAKDPNSKGRVTVEFVIGGTGKVASATVKETTMSDAAVATCISAAIKRWTFPKPEGGGSVTVAYPFVLEPG
jgi:Ca-activated chloride channel family protein